MRLIVFTTETSQLSQELILMLKLSSTINIQEIPLLFQVFVPHIQLKNVFSFSKTTHIQKFSVYATEQPS